MSGESRLRENCTSGSEGRAEAAARRRHLPRPDTSGIGSLGRAEREAERQDVRARGRCTLIAANPFGGLAREGLEVKPEDPAQSAASTRRRTAPPLTPPRGELVGAVPGPREPCRGAQTRRAERRCPWHRRDEHQGAAALASQPLAGGPLSARGGHLSAAACPEGDDPQALGRDANAGGAGCGGSVDLPGHRAGAHASLRSAVPSP